MNNKSEKFIYMAMFFGNHEKFLKENLGIDDRDIRYKMFLNITVWYVEAENINNAFKYVIGKLLAYCHKFELDEYLSMKKVIGEIINTFLLVTNENNSEVVYNQHVNDDER